jgi:hypothetical protein
LPVQAARRILEFLRRHGWAIMALLAVLAFFSPLLLKWSWYGKGDWGYFHFLDHVARRTVLDFGELPEWNPYQCGGNVLAANTQAHILSPWLAFPLAFGPAAGAKLAATVHGLLGALGMWVLLGAMGIRGAGRFLGTVLFACSGFFGHQIAGGHVWALPFYYVPWVVYFLLRGSYELKWAALAGLFWGLMAMEGGVYPAPYTGILVGAVVLAMALGWMPLEGKPRARWWKPPAAFGVCLVAFALIAAAKLVPDLFHMAAHPRRIPDYPRIGLGTLLDAFTWRNLQWGWDRPSHHDYPWWGEYGSYIGWAGIVLAAGAIVLRFRRVRVSLVLLAVSLTMALGALGPWTPWDTLHRLPVFENLRVPSRFVVFSMLAIAWLAAVAVHDGEAWLRKTLTGRYTRWVAILLPALVAVGIAADTTLLNANPFWPAFVEQPPKPDEPPAPMKQVKGSYKRMYDHVAVNHGTLTCQEINSIPRSPRLRQQDDDYGIAPSEDGTVKLLDWSPNEMNYEVDLARPALLWINQNYHKGWSTTVGKVEPLDNQLTVQLPAGKYRVRLLYRAPGLRLGLAMTGAGVLLIAGWFGFDWWWRKRRGTACDSARPDHNGTACDSARPDHNGTACDSARPAAPARFTRRWWVRVFALDAAFVIVSLGIPVVSLLIAEPRDLERMAQVHDYIRPRFHDGDVLQFSSGWVGDPARLFTGLSQIPPTQPTAVVEGAWHRLWFVFCQRDGDQNRLKDLLRRFAELDRRTFGEFTVYLLEPENAADLIYLDEHLAEARARVISRKDPPRDCTSRDGGPPLICGPQPYLEIKKSLEKIGGQHRNCIWMHPQADDAELELTFPGILEGVEPTFVFRYGLTDAAITAKNGGAVSVAVSAGRVRLRSVVAENEAGWNDIELDLPPGVPRDLVITVHAPNAGARHFCVNAILERSLAPSPDEPAAPESREAPGP